MSEYSRLKEISESIRYDEGIMTKVTQYSGTVIKRNMVEGSILELGPAEGVMTEVIYTAGGTILS